MGTGQIKDKCTAIPSPHHSSFNATTHSVLGNIDENDGDIVSDDSDTVNTSESSEYQFLGTNSSLYLLLVSFPDANG